MIRISAGCFFSNIFITLKKFSYGILFPVTRLNFGAAWSLAADVACYLFPLRWSACTLLSLDSEKLDCPNQAGQGIQKEKERSNLQFEGDGIVLGLHVSHVLSVNIYTKRIVSWVAMLV